MTQNETNVCGVCGLPKDPEETVFLRLVRPSIQALILRDHPGIGPDSVVCRDDLNRYRALYVQNVLESEKGELSAIEAAVVESLKEGDVLTRNVNADFEERRTFGERMADRIARFGGSWRFILIFAGGLVAWILLNTFILLSKRFDPYPFILLNLALSCLAAIQAPIIMMSQNRQEAKDRLRAEHDYQVNLKAEIEIRGLHEKIDHLIDKEWQKLMEIQEIQTELMAELSEKLPGAARRPEAGKDE